MISQFASVLVTWQSQIWGFLISNWFTSAILISALILPKIFDLVKKTLGK